MDITPSAGDMVILGGITAADVTDFIRCNFCVV